MNERIMQFRVGLTFLATLIITAILLVMFGKLPTLMGHYYSVQIRFNYASGVSERTRRCEKAAFLSAGSQTCG